MTSQKMMKSNGADRRTLDLPPEIQVTKFLEHVGERAWTDAEKELDVIRQKSDGSQWSRGYVKALEGLILTYRNNDDKYIFLPKILATGSEDATNSLKKEFEAFSTNELHSEYDRGYFKALDDYLSQIHNAKKQSSPEPKRDVEQATLDQSATSTGQG